MADLEGVLEFLERGVGMRLDVNLKLLRVEFAPFPPTGFGRERPGFHGGQIAVNGAASEVKVPGGLHFGAAFLNELHHPLPQIQGISFHARKPTTLCANVNMKCYSFSVQTGGAKTKRKLTPICQRCNLIPGENRAKVVLRHFD
jgi:hypothetical protein